ncbi:uncharacterized protein [Nicotiana tomentosiformis]|uniref:uncharacterized protein n=1 Tax=Nicotiana tomentosiformis TaxID=4098 RepID=UPI00388CC405
MEDDLADAYSTLMYVDLKIKNTSVMTVVDTVAMHTFVASRIVQEYELQVTKCPMKMNAFNMTVVPLDDFNVLLGIDFLKKNKVAPIPYLDGRLQKDEKTYLAALVEVKPDVHIEVPDCVADFLKKFKPVMPPELPRDLPLRREIDHRIELIPGSLLPARPPYCMSPMELIELRKQLSELLYVGLIQP